MVGRAKKPSTDRGGRSNMCLRCDTDNRCSDEVKGRKRRERQEMPVETEEGGGACDGGSSWESS